MLQSCFAKAKCLVVSSVLVRHRAAGPPRLLASPRLDVFVSRSVSDICAQGSSPSGRAGPGAQCGNEWGRCTQRRGGWRFVQNTILMGGGCGCGGGSCCRCGRGTHPGVVHASESGGHEARGRVGEVSVEGGMVHRGVEAPVLVVLSEHVEAIALLQLGALLFPPLLQGQGVGVVAIKVVRLAVPVGALCLVQARPCQPVQRIVPQQQVPGQRVSPVNVQAPVGVSHWVPVEGRVGESVSSWDGTDTHKGRHDSSSL